MKTYRKVSHWFFVLSFIGLCITALAADWFFSKEAILKSFDFSLNHLGLDIPPLDQMYIARIERRITWDWHFYSGIIFFISLAIAVFTKNFKLATNISNYIKIAMIMSGFILAISGLLLYLRLFIQIEPYLFQLLKEIHNIAKWVFIVAVISHVFTIIRLENTSHVGLISNMFRKGK